MRQWRNETETETLMSEKRKINRLCMGGLMLALGIILPMVFHLTGVPQSGMVFLPMHIPVLLTGFFLGPFYGLAIGILAPVISFLLTNMPTAARLPFMMLELASYGAVSGFIYHRIIKYKYCIMISLMSAMIAGRLIYGIALWVAAGLFHIPCGGPIAAWKATIVGIYGILIQLLIIPSVVYAMKKGELLNGIFGTGKKTSL